MTILTLLTSPAMPTSSKHRHYTLIEKALRYIQQQQARQPSLAAVAEHCALSEFHFQRLFTDWAGVSPKQFLGYLTREQAKARLLAGASALEASQASGLSSSSRLHDLMITMEAVTPGELKGAGAGIEFYYGSHQSPFGRCFIAANSRGIHRLEFITDSDHQQPLTTLQAIWPKARFSANQDYTAALIDNIFRERPSTAKASQKQPLKLWVKGSSFQLKVWEALLQIPDGALASYASIADRIGQPGASRAVGTAVGANRLALLIPCHRVIQSMGTLGNYHWGEYRKQALVGWEAAQQDSQQTRQQTQSQQQ